MEACALRNKALYLKWIFEEVLTASCISAICLQVCSLPPAQRVLCPEPCRALINRAGCPDQPFSEKHARQQASTVGNMQHFALTEVSHASSIGQYQSFCICTVSLPELSNEMQYPPMVSLVYTSSCRVRFLLTLASVLTHLQNAAQAC